MPVVKFTLSSAYFHDYFCDSLEEYSQYDVGRTEYEEVSEEVVQVLEEMKPLIFQEVMQMHTFCTLDCLAWLSMFNVDMEIVDEMPTEGNVIYNNLITTGPFEQCSKILGVDGIQRWMESYVDDELFDKKAAKEYVNLAIKLDRLDLLDILFQDRYNAFQVSYDNLTVTKYMLDTCNITDESWKYLFHGSIDMSEEVFRYYVEFLQEKQELSSQLLRKLCSEFINQETDGRHTITYSRIEYMLDKGVNPTLEVLYSALHDEKLNILIRECKKCDWMLREILYCEVEYTCLTLSYLDSYCWENEDMRVDIIHGRTDRVVRDSNNKRRHISECKFIVYEIDGKKWYINRNYLFTMDKRGTLRMTHKFKGDNIVEMSFHKKVIPYIE